RTPAGRVTVRLPLPGLYNVYNALAATAAALGLGASLEHVQAGLERMSAVFGRVETIPVSGRDVSILLVKNPAGTNEVLRTLTLDAAVAMGDGAPLYALPTYTALLELRGLLADRGVAKRWSE